jgi:hypothetical protein
MGKEGNTFLLLEQIKQSQKGTKSPNEAKLSSVFGVVGKTKVLQV